jgi:5-oxoprolinase (ATP-hydrolysing)
VVDPVMLEVFNNLFMNIAEQMGCGCRTPLLGQHQGAARLLLRAVRRDGNLIANAPHMPVHLGSMSESIKTVMRATRDGCSPATSTRSTTRTTAARTCPTSPWSRRCFSDDAVPILFYVASRGHHADIGGVTPGSMPPFSTRIEEEGRADRQLQSWSSADRLREAEMLCALLGGRVPVAQPAQNIADLKAQIAANEKGVQELRTHGRAVRPRRRAGLHGPRAGQRRGVGAPRHHAPEGRRFTLPLDNGAKIRSRSAWTRGNRAHDRLHRHVAQLPEQLQRAHRVCMAAVLYVFRTLVDDDIPLNAGCLKPLDVIIPPARC